MRMRRIITGSVLLAAVSCASLVAQTAEDSVRAVVRQARDGLAGRDTAGLLLVFDSSAKLILISSDSGRPPLAVVPIRAIINSLSRPGPRRREETRNERVTLAADLATVVADYAFYFDDRVHHCGVVMYDLIRSTGLWRIVEIRQTDRRAGCES